MRRICLLLFALLACCGCGSSYSWRSSVPKNLRTISVPTFRNESYLSEAGAVATRQILREIQREGTFRIASGDDAVLEIQGSVKSVGSSVSGYSRAVAMRVASYAMNANVEVSVIDRRRGRILVNNRIYRPQATFTAEQDLETSQRDSLGQLMDDLSRQVVDDLLNLNW